MSTQAPAFVRTGAPILGGAVIIQVARALGLELTVDQAAVLTPLVMYGYYVLGRALESWNPKLGYVLGIAKKPVYSSEPAPSPAAGEDLTAVVVPEETSPPPVDEPVDEAQLPFEQQPATLMTSTPLAELRATGVRPTSSPE